MRPNPAVSPDGWVRKPAALRRSTQLTTSRSEVEEFEGVGANERSE